MKKRSFNTIGWLILLGMTGSWIFYGYTNVFLFLLPIAGLCFSIYDGSIKQWEIMRRFSVRQVFTLIGTFIVAVAIAFAFVLLAIFLIRDLFQLQGWLKTVLQFIAVILALFPAQYLFSSVLLKVTEEAVDK